MDKSFLYFLEALYQIDRKFFGKDNYFNRKSSFQQLLEWGQISVEWNRDSLSKLRLLQAELVLTGLEVSEISEMSYSYILIAKLPKNPTTELLYGEA